MEVPSRSQGNSDVSVSKNLRHCSVWLPTWDGKSGQRRDYSLGRTMRLFMTSKVL